MVEWLDGRPRREWLVVYSLGDNLLARPRSCAKRVEDYMAVIRKDAPDQESDLPTCVLLKTCFN